MAALCIMIPIRPLSNSFRNCLRWARRRKEKFAIVQKIVRAGIHSIQMALARKKDLCNLGEKYSKATSFFHTKMPRLKCSCSRMITLFCFFFLPVFAFFFRASGETSSSSTVFPGASLPRPLHRPVPSVRPKTTPIFDSSQKPGLPHSFLLPPLKFPPFPAPLTRPEEKWTGKGRKKRFFIKASGAKLFPPQ